MHTRIVLVDDHRILLDALKNLVEPEFEVVGVYEDCQTLIENAAELRPDIIVLDIGMPEINGLTAGIELRKLVPKTRLIFLTVHRDLERAAEAFRLGASGYVLKNAAGTELIGALREVARGGYYASAVLIEGMTGSFVQTFKQMKGKHKLTPRQTAVLQLLWDGKTMNEAAKTLNITARTVAFHKYAIMEKLRIKSNSELMNFASSYLPSSQQ